MAWFPLPLLSDFDSPGTLNWTLPENALEWTLANSLEWTLPVNIAEWTLAGITQWTLPANQLEWTF